MIKYKKQFQKNNILKKNNIKANWIELTIYHLKSLKNDNLLNSI